MCLMGRLLSMCKGEGICFGYQWVIIREVMWQVGVLCWRRIFETLRSGWRSRRIWSGGAMRMLKFWCLATHDFLILFRFWRYRGFEGKEWLEVWESGVWKIGLFGLSGFLNGVRGGEKSSGISGYWRWVSTLGRVLLSVAIWWEGCFDYCERGEVWEEELPLLA